MAQLAGSSVVIKELEMSGSTDLPLVNYHHSYASQHLNPSPPLNFEKQNKEGSVYSYF